MRKLFFVVVMTASFLLYLYLDATITFAASESEPAVFQSSPNSTPSLDPSVSYYVYDERYNPFISEIDEAVRNVLKHNWMLPSPLVIELGKPLYECPQEAIAYFCLDTGRGYSYIDFMPASLNQGITQRYNTYYHELGHAAAEATGLFFIGDPCIEQNTYGQWQPWACQWNEGFAEFFSANFMNRNQSLFRVEDEQSPAFVANTMLEKVSKDGWDFFLCIYDEARTAIVGGYWTRYKWELAVRKCQKPLKVSLIAPTTVREGDILEVSAIIQLQGDVKAILLSYSIPPSLQIVGGEPRQGWLNPQPGATLRAMMTLKALSLGTFVLRASITVVTALGAQSPFTIETTITIMPRGETPPPWPSKTPEQFFDSNANRRLDDLEILTALDYWIKQRPVPDIGVLSELQILALLDKWIKGTPIAGR